MIDYLARSWAMATLCCLAVACGSGDDGNEEMFKTWGGDSEALSDACKEPEQNRPIFGPRRFIRTTGKPFVETVEFEIPSDGALCILVRNGNHSPPQGQRVSSAWVKIDEVPVFSPDAFSQNTAILSRDWTIGAGLHALSVQLASGPDSFLEIELSLSLEDSTPPSLQLDPPDGGLASDDTPLLRVSFSDDGSGVDSSTLIVLLNGEDVTPHFVMGEAQAIWQVPMESFLDEGANTLLASLTDRQSNLASSESTFQVTTTTSELLDGFSSEDESLLHRSAYKLIFRQDEIPRITFRRCLRNLVDVPEPRAATQLGEILRTAESDALARSLAAGALGEAALVDSSVGMRSDLVQLLGEAVLQDKGLAVKSLAARALGQTMNQEAVPYLDEFLEEGPAYPPMPPDCEIENKQRCGDYITYLVVTGFQVLRSTIRIAGHDHVVGNPGQIMEIWKEYYRKLDEYFEPSDSTGGAP